MEVEQLRQNIQQKSQKKIEQIKKNEMEKAEKELEEIKLRFEKQEKSMLQYAEEHKEEWINSILNKIIGRC